MACAQARGLVAAYGSIVLGTGPHTYDRYVLHRGFCFPGQTIRSEWVPTADTPQCFVGYTCQDDDYWFDW